MYPPPDDDRARELERGTAAPERREFDREEFTRGAADLLPEPLRAFDELLRTLVFARERVRGANVPGSLRLALDRGTDEFVWRALGETRELVRGATEPRLGVPLTIGSPVRKVRLRVAERSGVARTVADELPDRLPENVRHCEPLVVLLRPVDVVALGEPVVARVEPVVARREPVVARVEPVVARVEPVVRREPAVVFAVAGDAPRVRPGDPPKPRHSVPERLDVPERVAVPARVPPACAGSPTAALVPPRDRPEALGNPAAPPERRVAVEEPLTDPVEPVPDDTAACEPRDR